MSKSKTQLKTDELLAQLRAQAVHNTVPEGYTAIGEIGEALGMSPQHAAKRLRAAGVARVKVRGATSYAYAYENEGTLAALSAKD